MKSPILPDISLHFKAQILPKFSKFFQNHYPRISSIQFHLTIYKSISYNLILYQLAIGPLRTS